MINKYVISYEGWIETQILNTTLTSYTEEEMMILLLYCRCIDFEHDTNIKHIFDQKCRCYWDYKCL